MHPHANTDHPVHQLIRERWSPRSFSSKEVSPEVLRSLFEAARWTPSSSNEQPWAFLVATKDQPDEFQRILGTLVEFNQNWAKHAPVLVVAVSSLEFARNHSPNRNAHYDTGAAVAHLTFEATSRGLVVHQMGGFDQQKAREALHIPKGWEPIAVFTIGYPGDAESLPEPLKSRELSPRTRKPLSEIVMSATWGQNPSFLAK